MSFKKNVSKYQLSRLLEISSLYSQRLFGKTHPVADLHRFTPSFFIKGAYKLTGSTYLTPWSLVDLSYFAIYFSHDFKETIPNEQDFRNLYNQLLTYDEQLASTQYGMYNKEDKAFNILFKYSQKQFWYQARYRLVEMNARFYDLLYQIPKNDSLLPNFYQHLENKYNIEFSAYNLASMAILHLIASNTYFRFPYNFNQDLTRLCIDKELLNKMLLDYTSDYKCIRESPLKAQQLLLNPIIRTSKNKLLNSSTFLVAKKAATNLYWETRKLYQKETGKDLNQPLGGSFEIYVDELLGHYLPNEAYKRIKPIKNAKRADVVIETKKFIIIIEQKFSMLNISLQCDDITVNKIDRWLKSYTQAIEQLEETESDIGKTHKTIIKLILFFDDLYIADSIIIDRVVKLYRKNGHDKAAPYNVFMIGIGSYEMLIYLIANDEVTFNRVLKAKIKRQRINDPVKAVEFEDIFNEFNLLTNDYMDYKINHIFC